jgi:HlyD family secretion protein
MRWIVAALVVPLAACTGEPREVALGTVEWDRIELIAEATEPVLEIAVRENQRVAAGDLLLRLDDRRAAAELAQATAEVARLTALLEEQHNGVRPETIAEARARVSRAQSLAHNAEQDRVRAADLRSRRLASPAELDRAEATARAAAAEQRAASAALDQLLAGTRVETLAQTEAALAAAKARQDVVAIAHERLTVRAPRAGRIDAIPVEVGDQPARGAWMISLLVGDAPHARVFVPERLRAGLMPDAAFEVQVEGVPDALEGRLRQVRSEPSFTPYYALTGDDASRLTYVAEIELLGERARSLPAGLPATAQLRRP